jgi:hypothetical protein
MNPLCPQCNGLGYVKNQYKTTALDVTCSNCNGVIVQNNPLIGHYRHIWIKYGIKLRCRKRIYWFYTDDTRTIKPNVIERRKRYWGYITVNHNGVILQPTTIQLLPEIDHNVLMVIKTSLNQNVPQWMYNIAMKSVRPVYVAQILTLKHRGYKHIDVLDDGTEIYRATYVNKRTDWTFDSYKYLTPCGNCGNLNNDGKIPYTAQH